MVFAEQLLARLQDAGLQDYVLPLLLVFVILYGVLDSLSLFKKKKIDAAIAGIGSLMVVTYTPFVEGVFQVYVINLFGSISILLIGLLGFLMLAGMAMGKDVREELKNHDTSIMIAAGLAVLFMFMSYGGSSMLGLGREYITEGDVYLIIILAALIGFMGWIVGAFGEEDSKEDYPVETED